MSLINAIRQYKNKTVTLDVINPNGIQYIMGRLIVANQDYCTIEQWTENGELDNTFTVLTDLIVGVHFGMDEHRHHFETIYARGTTATIADNEDREPDVGSEKR